MNQDYYRVIFNRHRAVWMAVPEAARSGRAGPSASRVGRPALLHSLAAPLALALAASAGQAQIIADPGAPGTQRPTVLRSANGTPTVNIQSPCAAGVSRNRYQQFDIGQRGERGAILNNSHSAVPSRIGGGVAGNPWLAKGSARV